MRKNGGADQKEGFTKKKGGMPHFFIVLSTKLKQLYSLLAKLELTESLIMYLSFRGFYPCPIMCWECYSSLLY